MTALDHLVFATPDLEEGVAIVAALTGVQPTRGGPHVGIGTHNALLSLGGDTYLEIIGVDPDQPAPSGPRPFGLDEGNPSRLAAFVGHPEPGDTLEAVADRARAAGHDPGAIRPMSRVTPQGRELSWRLTYTGQQPAGDGLVPFLIEWGTTPSPALTSPGGCTLVALVGYHPDPAPIVSALSALEIDVQIHRGDAPALVATIDCPAGRVELR